ncbi:heavy-metal-associated domain-containing protein [Amycolatopsis rubida]|uniref:Copper ion binding protein n=1 Tax=Amycolatopsis rubida TaxID=112413 RepID=A0A1I5YSZ2_9PSEU|nr:MULTISPECIES: copper ion binding protein [Amycolatopsis]MYW95977.1 copper ion binding protein [Amycolatopsis rubida]NEC60967.1 heavy-metal-associated domain-containing protein [Amycolatopsis rubida]OAP20513.1 Copper chaperone CopZ [Amycolatopsis sp. M39]SFQ47361.1 copper ion binding protein [Amycolatopsis rubida]
MTETTYTVQGMTCGHCVGSVKEEVGDLAGVRTVDVDLATGAVKVTSAEPISHEAVKAAVAEAGYQVVA